MTVKKLYKPNWILIAGMPMAIFASCWLVTILPVYQQHSHSLSIAIAGDLLITAPIIYYLLIRNTAIPRVTVLRILFIGLLLAGMIINAKSLPYLQPIKKWMAPILEAALIFFIVSKFYSAIKEARLHQQGKPDFLVLCRNILLKVTGNDKISNVLASEIAVFYYAFIARKEKNFDGKTRFSSYKENSISIFLFTFLCLFLIETTGVHFLLLLWNKTFTWIISVLSIYTCLQLFAHIRAIKSRSIFIGGNCLDLTMGLAADCSIAFSNIREIEMTKKKSTDPNAIKIALINGIETHNFIIHLHETVTVTKMFGIKKQTKTILFFVDQPNVFLQSLNAAL